MGTADAGIEHVCQNDIGNCDKDTGEERDGNIQRALGAAGGFGGLSLVDNVDALGSADVLSDRTHRAGNGLCDLSRLLGIGAGNRKRNDTRGGLTDRMNGKPCWHKATALSTDLIREAG